MDLNLLVILDALLEERTVTGAAKRLGVTQPAVSHALKRLRDHFGDPLLVRTSSGMTPTLRAQELRDPIRRSLATLREVSEQPSSFDPKTATRMFTLAMTDQMGVVLLPAIHARIRELAPRVDLRIVPVVRDVERTLESNSVDLVVTGAFAPADSPGLFRQRLFEEPLVCVVRADHPTVTSALTLERFCELSHAIVAPRGGRGIVDSLLAERGLSRRVAVVVPHFLVAPFLIATSDLVLTVAESTAKALASLLPLRIVAPPLELPRAMYLQMWHQRSHEDSGHKWLRNLVQVVAEKHGRQAASAARGA